MPIYETVLIVRQELSEPQVKSLTDHLVKISTDLGGKLLKTEQWGLRNFAYPINKAKKGHYVLIEQDAPPAALAEMERTMRFNEDVTRFMSIRLEAPSKAQSAILNKDEDDFNLNTDDVQAQAA